MQSVVVCYMHSVSILLVLIQSGVYHHLRSLSVASQPIPMHGVVSPKLQNFMLLLIECHEVSVGPLFPFFKVPLDSSSAIQHVSCAL